MERLGITATVTIAFFALATAARADTQHPRWLSAANWPVPPMLVIHAEPCPSGQAVACASEPTGEIFVPAETDVFTRWHEVGHIFDFERLAPGDRAWFTRMLRLKGVWDRGTGENHGHVSPDERFADAYAACATRMRPDSGSWESAYDYNPTPRQYRAICSAIKRIAARAGS